MPGRGSTRKTPSLSSSTSTRRLDLRRRRASCACSAWRPGGGGPVRDVVGRACGQPGAREHRGVIGRRLAAQVRLDPERLLEPVEQRQVGAAALVERRGAAGADQPRDRLTRGHAAPGSRSARARASSAIGSRMGRAPRRGRPRRARPMDRRAGSAGPRRGRRRATTRRRASRARARTTPAPRPRRPPGAAARRAGRARGVAAAARLDRLEVRGLAEAPACLVVLVEPAVGARECSSAWVRGPLGRPRISSRPASSSRRAMPHAI